MTLEAANPVTPTRNGVVIVTGTPSVTLIAGSGNGPKGASPLSTGNELRGTVPARCVLTVANSWRGCGPVAGVESMCGARTHSGKWHFVPTRSLNHAANVAISLSRRTRFRWSGSYVRTWFGVLSCRPSGPAKRRGQCSVKGGWGGNSVLTRHITSQRYPMSATPADYGVGSSSDEAQPIHVLDECQHRMLKVGQLE